MSRKLAPTTSVSKTRRESDSFQTENLVVELRQLIADARRQAAATTEAEQQIWNECPRLIANTIIFYNPLLLSCVYEQMAAAGDLDAIKILQGISPVAWRNVHLIGNFDFTTASSEVDIEAVAARYQNEDFWERSMSDVEDEGLNDPN